MSAARGISVLSLLWPVLAMGYLGASATGYRSIALAIVGLMTGTLVAASGHRLVGVITAVALSASCLYWTDSLVIFVYLPPVAGFAFMAFFFGRTLCPGSEPLITRVARREHRDLPIEIARYTRSLTWLWTWCFVLLLAVALLLVPVLPLHSWSRGMQGLGIALPATLFLGEYVYRHRRLPEYEHAPLLTLTLNIIAVIKEAAMKSAPAAGRDSRQP